MATGVRERPKAAPEFMGSPHRELSAFLSKKAHDVGAAFYLLFNPSDQRGNWGRIVACNWPYDAVAEVGLAAIARIAECGIATLPGRPPRGFHPLLLAARAEHEEVGLLAHYGHQEIFVLALPFGRRRLQLMVSAGKPGVIDASALPRMQMACCYAVSRFIPGKSPPEENPLSKREQECLAWVSEGKTTDEVALILNLSTSAVNSQVAHAIHKLRARNRAMAIATAIRRNLI